MKQQEYAKQVNYKNRQEVKTKPKVYEPEEEEDIMNKRKIVSKAKKLIMFIRHRPHRLQAPGIKNFFYISSICIENHL